MINNMLGVLRTKLNRLKKNKMRKLLYEGQGNEVEVVVEK